MVKIVCNTPNREDIGRFWIQIPEPPENHVDFIRKSVKKYCGDTPHQVTRMAKFQYKLKMVCNNDASPTDYQVYCLLREDYNQ